MRGLGYRFIPDQGEKEPAHENARKISAPLFGQLLLVILLMSVLAVASFFYLDWRFSEAEANAGLTKATADSFEAWLDKTKTAHGMSMNF